MMELHAKDQRHINEQVRLVNLRIKHEATEYARLCELYYLRSLRDKLEAEIQACEQYPEMIKQVYNKC